MGWMMLQNARRLVSGQRNMDRGRSVTRHWMSRRWMPGWNTDYMLVVLRLRRCKSLLMMLGRKMMVIMRGRGRRLLMHRRRMVS
jgi:hypothetical protein